MDAGYVCTAVVLGAHTEMLYNTVIRPFSQPLKEHSHRAKPKYNQFGKCSGALSWCGTINRVSRPQATVPVPDTSAVHIPLMQTQGVCYLALCSDFCGDTKPRLLMPTSQPNMVLQPALVLLLCSVIPSQ